MSRRISHRKDRVFVALLLVTMLLFADLAFSAGNHGGTSVESGPLSNGMMSAIEPPQIHRSKTFPRLGSVALNLTDCLHNTSTDVSKGFTCAHDIYGAFASAHSNGDHFGNTYRHFIDYFETRYLNDKARWDLQGIHSGHDLQTAILKQHGMDETLYFELCGLKTKPLSDARILPDALSHLPLSMKIMASSLCRFAPFYEDTKEPDVAWWMADYEPDPGEHEHEGSDPTGGAFGSTGRDGGDVLGLEHAAGGHGHMGPHGLDFNTELNWVYAALSHQGKVAMINLNVIDWGKVATFEERTGYRVLLFDDEAVFEPDAVLHYASELLRQNLGHEKEYAKSVDAAHRYCFSQSLDAWNARGGVFRDDTPRPEPVGEELENALAFFREHAPAPVLQSGTVMPPQAGGWACFFAFTGIAARSWTDPEFMNPFCSFDTRHLAVHDARLSPGRYSRTNLRETGAGDAWRCDWFIRYQKVTSDIPIRIRREVPVELAADFPVPLEQHVTQEEPAEVPGPGMEWVELEVNVSIGPHDVTYNPVNGLLYVTHYWELNDPDVRMLPDWTIHAIDGNPASPAFNNPYNTTKGVPRPSRNAVPGGTPQMDGKAYPIDVGGPVDGLHPMSSEVDVRNGRVFIANRESNTISVLFHDGGRDFTTDKASVTLKGPTSMAINLDLDRQRGHERDFTLYHDANQAKPINASMIGGWFDFSNVTAKGRCRAFEDLAAADDVFGQNLTAAIDACKKELIATANAQNQTVAEAARPGLEALVRRLLHEEGPWDLVLQDLRQVLGSEGKAYDALAEAFRERWLPGVVLPEDRAFLEEALDAMPLVAPSQRPDAIMEFFARAEDRFWGRSGALVEDLVELAPGLLEDHFYAQSAMEVLVRHAEDAMSGELLGHLGGKITVGRLELVIRAVEPTVSASLITGTPLWLAYCVSYSADDWVFHAAQGENPWAARGKEARNGLHPFHCDDVTKIHYPEPTPIQTDYAGWSNHHHVVIVREPIGPMLMDYWFEARPRILQPFDLWFNAGDGTLYISNLGNHDNVPIVQGWIAILNEGGNVPCHDEKMMGENRPVQSELLDQVFALVLSLLPKLSCTLPRPSSGFTANLLLEMDLMPHHINVNPYTFEVYGGHLLSDYVMAAQFEAERVEWAIPRAHIAGSDTIRGASLVPNPNPTGMGVNPSTQRLFASHFQQSKPLYVPLTGRMEDTSRYVTPIDLRNYTLMNDMVYGGDHHVAVDQTRPPGTGTYEFPFYNRSRTLNVSGSPVQGHMVAVGDTGGSLEIFWRCTYYRVQLEATTTTFPSPLDGISVRHPYNASNQFSAGRCWNLFDLQPQLKSNHDILHLSPEGYGVFKDGTQDRVFWEFGAEHITFGQLNLFFDPDNVPAGLRVTSPHGRDHDRSANVGVQATEELVGLWAESDVPKGVDVPRGDLLLRPAAPPARVNGTWTLEFDTTYQVEYPGPRPPPRPDEMRVLLSTDLGNGAVNVTVHEGWAGAASGKQWIETRVNLRQAFGRDPTAPVTAAFTFDSKDDKNNDGTGWTIAGLSLETANGDPIAQFPLHQLPGYQPKGGVAKLLAQDPFDAGRVVDAIGFRDPITGTYANGQQAWTGAFDFTFASAVENPVLVILHRQDVEPEREWRGGQPRDAMIVEASLDGGTTWHDVWRRDSRDAPLLAQETQRIDVTNLVLVANGHWHDAFAQEWSRANFTNPAPERPLLFRFRFDAMDPAFNELPGWRVLAPALRHDATPGHDRALVVQSGLAQSPGATPVWWQDGDGAYRFTNHRLTYATGGGEGGAHGTLCRAEHGRFGTWGTSYRRGPGSGALTLVGRDLAGQTTRLRHQEGRGVALVSDTFENGFSESFWRREEVDPHGVGHPAYVFDPTPEGQGDLTPEDTPVQYAGGGALPIVNQGSGELVRGQRGLLIEVPPHASNFFWDDTELVTETAALVDDGIQYRRAFVLTPDAADGERLPAGLREVLHREDTFLNATHVALKRQPEPVHVTLKELDDLIQKTVTQDEMADGFDLDRVVEEFLRTAKMAAQLGQNYGMRDQPTDQYVLDGTRDLPLVATERLLHEFNFSRDANEPVSLDLQLDFVARHRFEDTIVKSKPTLPRLDPSFLDWLVNNVTIEKLNLTRAEIVKITGANNLTNETVDDALWRATHTLGDLGVDPFGILNGLLATAEDLLAFDVPVSEILNDLDRLQMSLPTYGEGFGVRVLLRDAAGGEKLIAQREGASLSRWHSFAPEGTPSDARVTLVPGATPGAYEVALGADVGRFEKLRVHLDAAEVAGLLPASGNYTLVIESTIRAGDAPAPGVTYEIAYSDLELRVGLDGAGNEAPDAAFTWMGPVSATGSVTFLPGNHPDGLGRIGDLDGHVRAYRWEFPAGTGALRFGDEPLVADLVATPADDALTNVNATGWGRLARNLTWNPASGVLAYEATGCRIPVPTVTLPGAGDHVVKLTVTDDGGASRTLAQTVVVSGPRRAPEIVSDPYAEGERTRVVWQDNPGSLLLHARGRSLNLSNLVDMVAKELTYENLKNRTTLADNIDYALTAEVNRSQVLNATVDAKVVLNATLNGTELPDIMLDWLLIRPGTVRVVALDPEDATNGTRAQVLLGDMPETTMLSLPLLIDLLNLDLGLPHLEEQQRSAHAEARQALGGTQQLVDGCVAAAAQGSPCGPGLDDLVRLVESGLLDAWTFRFAIHPEKAGGGADLNKTLAQIVVMDTGVGVLYLMALDALDDANQTAGEIVDEIERDLQKRLQGLDAIVPVTPYVALLNALQQEASNMSLVVPAAASLRTQLLNPTSLLPDSDLKLQEALGVALKQVEQQQVNHKKLLDAVNRSRDAGLAYVQTLRDAQNASLGEGMARLDLWSANAVTNVSLGSAREAYLSAGARGNASLDAAAGEILNATEAARRVVANLSAAADTTRYFAMNWTETVLRRDPDELEARFRQLARNVTANLHDVANDTADIYRNVTDFLDRRLGTKTLTWRAGPLDHEHLVIGYDSTQNKATLRVGDEVVREGVLKVAASPKVYTSITFTSIGNRTAEVQAIWGERGATLREGFNRDADLAGSRYAEENLSRGAAHGDAFAKILQKDTVEPKHQLMWATRSAEGWLAREGGGDFANRHRFVTDAAGSPPSAAASRALAGVEESRAIRRDATLYPADVRARIDQPQAYGATLPLPAGALQEVRIASGAGGHRSAPAIFAPRGVPVAPYVFDVRATRGPGEPSVNETLQVAFQPTGLSDPVVSSWEVWLARRPDAGDDTSRMTKLGSVGPKGNLTLPAGFGEPGWTPGVDFHVYEHKAVPESFTRDWRYVVVRGVNDVGAGPFSVPYRVPPALLEETFSLLRAGNLTGANLTVDAERGDVDLTLWGLGSIKADTCLGDRVEVTRWSNYPHDEQASPWARSLRVQERGLDTVFSILRQLNRSLNEVPLNFLALDGVLDKPLLDKCPSLKSLVESLNGTLDPTILQGLDVDVNWTHPLLNPNATLGGGDFDVVRAVQGVGKQLLGDQRLNLSLKNLTHGTPATLTWRTAEAQGPYHARVRFMIPGPHLGPLSADTSIDRLLPNAQLGLLNALVPGERFHLLQLGNVDGQGKFEEVLRVDFDPHLLAPVDVEQTAEWVDEVAAGDKDPIGALAAGDLPLGYGIVAGDTNASRELIGSARPDRWYTIEVYAPDNRSDVYAVTFNGKMVGQFRTSSGKAPNALRLGGSHVPTEVLFDDVRFAPAIHPPAPVAQVVPLSEAMDFAAVRWHVPETGGAPLTDFNLLRVDLDRPQDAPQVVATAGAGHLRLLTDPLSDGSAVGRHYAYAVQAVNGLRDVRNVGPASTARSVVLPGFLRVSGDAAVSHLRETGALDDVNHEGDRLLRVGGAGLTTWRAWFQVNASQVVDAKGRALDPTMLGAATFLAYNLRQDDANSEAFHMLPTLEEVLSTLGYNRNMGGALGSAVTFTSAQQAAAHLDLVDPFYGEYLRKAYGDDAYAEYLQGLTNETRLGLVIACPDIVPKLLGHGHECRDADEEPIDHTAMCDDHARDLEIEEQAFNCWNNAVAAYVLGESGYDTRRLTWGTQPPFDPWRLDIGLMRQTTRDSLWRRYELLPSLLADDDGDVSVVLRKQTEQPISGQATYASREAGTWLDEALLTRGQRGFADGAGPADFPWSQQNVDRGARAVKVGGSAGLHVLPLAATGLPTVPLDAPMKVRVFIPEGSSPREIGLRISGGIGLKPQLEQPTATKDCTAYGGFSSTLVTWGDELVHVQDGEWVLDWDGELDHAADLLTPRERFTGHHAGGVPPVRGQWITLTFDPGQVALEASGLLDPERGLLASILNGLKKIRGPETNLWIPEHLAREGGIYERQRPLGFVGRVDHVDPDERDFVDKFPYDYHIPEWLFLWQNYDKFIEPWHCEMSVASLEFFVVGGEVWLDRVGPDLEPRVRLDAGGGSK